MQFQSPRQSQEEIAQRALRHLKQVVRIDSSSDERSDTIPSTPGQTELVRWLEAFFQEMGATTEVDPHSNLIATLEGRGAGQGKPPLALLIHVDTARGTLATEDLKLVPGWNGGTLTWERNENLQVNTRNYPSLRLYMGHDVLHGPGDAPFGLDDKLGLCHMMTLAWLLKENPEIEHPPLLLIGRPDEEIGRMEALEGLAALLQQRGVTRGYTLDGLDPFEINTANFNASQGSIWFMEPEGEPWTPHGALKVHIGGVNTHGATAKAEGHRPATRLAAELLQRLRKRGLSGRVRLSHFCSDTLRDCDATLFAHIQDEEAGHQLHQALAEVIGPHQPRGASWQTSPAPEAPAPEAATEAMLDFVHRFLSSRAAFILAAEDSDGWHGYSQPYRALPDEQGLRLDMRLRDFRMDVLQWREQHMASLAGDRPHKTWRAYINMGPALEKTPELAQLARDSAQELGLRSHYAPIRGGTGIDPFLDHGTAIANLGTGYFAPESEKELTSLQYMAQHAQWLVRLVQHFIDPRID